MSQDTVQYVEVPITIQAPQPPVQTYEVTQRPIYMERGHTSVAAQPRVNSVPVKSAPVTDQFGLETMAGLDGTLMASLYHYREFNYKVDYVGFKGGAQLQATTKYNTLFFTADARFAGGGSKYHGSVVFDDGVNAPATIGITSPAQMENLWDIRGLIGRDFVSSNWGFSPYTGAGYRFLHSDGRSGSIFSSPYDPTATYVAQGYRRENQLFYWPFGLRTRYRVGPHARVAAMFEYDYVWHGEQSTFLSDFGGQDVIHDQVSGRGLRAELMYETPTWSFGPFANYWNIDQSKLKCNAGCTSVTFEPHNWTYELGLQFRYHLLNW
jgi:hypothetical protein